MMMKMCLFLFCNLALLLDVMILLSNEEEEREDRNERDFCVFV